MRLLLGNRLVQVQDQVGYGRPRRQFHRVERRIARRVADSQELRGILSCAPVALFVAVKDTPGSTAPLGSATVPLTVADVD